MESTIYLGSGRINTTPAKWGGTNKANRVISTQGDKDSVFNAVLKEINTPKNTARNKDSRKASYLAKREKRSNK